jgi:hypothetical protein
VLKTVVALALVWALAGCGGLSCLVLRQALLDGKVQTGMSGLMSRKVWASSEDRECRGDDVLLLCAKLVLPFLSVQFAEPRRIRKRESGRIWRPTTRP